MIGLHLDGVVRRFGASAAPTLDGFSLHVPSGGCVALLGPSGAGKSTVLRLVAGLDRPDGGSIEIAGRCVLGTPPERRGTALVFQTPRLFPHLSVRDNVAFPLSVKGVRRGAARSSAMQFLELVGMEDLATRAPSSLSGGQQQRVSLARALAARPAVLLLDEPFGALDPEVRVQMHELLASLRATVEPTILLVTHDRDEAVTVADTVAVLLNGKVAQHAAPEELFRAPATLDVHRFLDGRNAVPGVVSGSVHHSVLGALELAERSAPDGAAALVFRHEAMRLTDETAGDVRGTVVRINRLGPRVTLEVDFSGHRLFAEAPAGSHVHVNQTVGLELPVSHRHVISTAAGRCQQADGPRPEAQGVQL